MKNLFGLIIFLFISNLTFGQHFEKTDSITLFESVQIEKEIKKGNILGNIIDTISTDKVYTDYAWTFNEKVDYENKQIDFQLLLSQEIFGIHRCIIRERNIYFIELSKYDSIFAEGKYTNKPDSLLYSMTKFIKNEDFCETLPQKRLKIIPYFDSVELTKHHFEIISVMVADSSGTKSSWKTLNQLINVILKSYIEVRNELSIKEWNKPYRKLKFEQQVAIINHYPINLWIYLNRHRVIPPPPPPYEMTEEYILDSLTKYYQKKAIEEILEK